MRHMDIPALLRRADSYAKATGRTTGGVSKAIFDDVRTLDLLKGGAKSITLARLEEAESRLGDLEFRAMSKREPAQ